MVKPLVEPKKTVISSLRDKLLSQGYSEEVEYDAINIEPVLIYSKSEKQVLFVKHKWSLVAQIPIQEEGKEGQSLAELEAKLPDNQKYKVEDEAGSRWLRFDLPSKQNELLEILSKL